MKAGICFKCGSNKSVALGKCTSCDAAPKTNGEYAISLVLSGHLSTEEQLTRYSDEIRSGKRASVPREALVQALNALKDPQIVAMLGTQSSTVGTTSQTRPFAQSKPRSAVAEPPSNQSTGAPVSRTKETSLAGSPFSVLGVTTRDDRHRIVERAEERSLALDNEMCQKARSELTSPRTRLRAEMAWLPGVSPRKAVQLVDRLLCEPMAVRLESGLPTLAHLNLMASAFETITECDDLDDLAEFVQQVAYRAEELNPEEILRDINEDRAVSGFPTVMAADNIEEELSERKRYYRDTIKDALNRLPSKALVQVMIQTVEGATLGGERHAPAVIDDLVDSYEVETQEFLEVESSNISKLIKSAIDSTESGEAAVKLCVEKIDAVVRNWHQVARPIQVSFRARGLDHERSCKVAWEIRSLAIDLFNKHQMLEQSQHLMALIGETFAEVPDVSQRVGEDAAVLSDIQQRRSEAPAIEPVKRLAEQIVRRVESRPSVGNVEGERLLSEGMVLLKAAPIEADSPTYREAQDIIAAGVMQCAVAFGKNTAEWIRCIVLLKGALELASDIELRKQLNECLEIVRRNHESLGGLKPVRHAPWLSTVNGMGFRLYGATDPKPDGSHMETYYFVALFIPIFPICRYRVIPTNGGYKFLGRGPLRKFDYWHIAIVIGLIICFFIAS